jgi:hypothetical protein
MDCFVIKRPDPPGSLREKSRTGSATPKAEDEFISARIDEKNLGLSYEVSRERNRPSPTGYASLNRDCR